MCISGHKWSINMLMEVAVGVTNIIMYPASHRLHKIKFSADEHGLNRGLDF